MVVCLHVWVQVNLVYSIPCTGVVRAKTHCDILQLSRSDTTHVVHHFPDSNDKFYVVLCCDRYFLMSRYSPTSYVFSLLLLFIVSFSPFSLPLQSLFPFALVLGSLS